jgi:tetratricopeptide (TPR) repeat protein
LVTIDPSRTANRVIRAEAQGEFAKLLASEGRAAEATQYAKTSIAALEELAERPDASEQYLCEASIVLMVTPVLSLRDYQRALRYAKRADELAQGKGWQSITYLAMAYANTGDAAKALETVERGLTIVPPPPSGQKPSNVRQNLEEERRDIQILVKTGHLPATFNQ